MSVGVSAQALSTADVSKLTVTVSGGGIAPDIVQDLVQSNGQWSGILGGIPAGANRTVSADAYDAGNSKIYSGQVSGVTVASGVTAAVILVLQDSAGCTPFYNSAPRITAVVASASEVEPGQTVDLTRG